MKIKEFPASVFRLAESMLIKEVVVVSKAHYDGWYKLHNATRVFAGDLFATKQEAIAEGERIIALQEKRLEKSLLNIAKRKRNLAKST